ncbi:MAG: aminotransferase class I/II-fold pyridoxal phosphate-dependent enzyme [Flavobacteriales bacterium]|nr:aminotransferase class I/II-fold pyridoxal phosphate-dependent enzyme [Flavobacteriales bacterium]
MLTVSNKAENLIGSEIIRLAGEINEMIKQGQTIHNFTIGDFNPTEFPIPEYLKERIIYHYQHNQTNYPASDGMPELRTAVSKFLNYYGGIQYSDKNEIIIAAGARPIIYSIFQTIIDPGDKVIIPVPSWNNNHYAFLSSAQEIIINTKPEHNFMPSAEDIKTHIQEASLLALCSPLNPTGTVFKPEQLEEICDLILEENRRREGKGKPLYLMYDQIYWLLTFGETRHVDPVSLRPAMRNYTVYVDGISKGFAATGVRVGWSFGPAHVIQKMKTILGHIGAWAPRAEQLATADFINNFQEVDKYISWIREQAGKRLFAFYEGFKQLKEDGFRVDAIIPQGAIYLTIQFDLKGMQTPNGNIIQTTDDVMAYLLSEAGFAIVPFYAFGSRRESNWYRLSIGTCSSETIPAILKKIRKALSQLA